LLSEAAGAVLGGQDFPSAYEDYQRVRGQRIALQTFLTDFRLFWEALAPALGKREKVVIDVEPGKIKGRRHLQLFDPEWFRPPPPVMVQPPRTPRGGRAEAHDEGP
jgi:hypothetical protein